MKTLYESLLDDFEKLKDSINPIDEIKRFLKDNYLHSYRFKISEKPNKDGYYEVSCDKFFIYAKKDIVSLTNDLFVFVHAFGFDCSSCPNLKSLKGAPKEVEKTFECQNCCNLTSLEGAPEKVGGDFNCSCCKNLTTLEGAPKEVLGGIACFSCGKLKNLKGAPKKVGDYFICSDCTNLTSLEGAPEKIDGVFNCSRCKNLTSLKGAPKKVGGVFHCRDCATAFTEQDVKDVCDVKDDVIY